MRLDASELGRLWEIKPILETLLFYYNVSYHRNNDNGTRLQQQLADNMSLQERIYSPQQQQQQLENPTEANVSLQDPRVRSSASATDAVSSNDVNNNVCLSPISEILCAPSVSAVILVASTMNQQIHQHRIDMRGL